MVEHPQNLYDLVGHSTAIIICWILLVLTVITVVYGVSSWCVIKNFRHIRNYVVLSTITTSALRFVFLIVAEYIVLTPIFVVTVSLLIYLQLSYCCWLLVLCYIFYVDFVKVFNIDISRRYLKSSLVGWGVPLVQLPIVIVPTLFLYYHGSPNVDEVSKLLGNSMTLIPVAISFIIYMLVLSSLFRDTEISASSSSNKWQRFYIATLIFVFGNILDLTAVSELSGKPNLVLNLIGAMGAFLNVIGLPIYFITLRSNRKLWREFLNKKAKPKSLEMK